MDKVEYARDIVARMMARDAFSRWMGIEVMEARPGFCQLQMCIREEMLNGFDIAHGGIAYALADSALAFASNGHGRKAVSVETSISHTQPLRAGDTLIATAEEEHLGDKIAIYRVRLHNKAGEIAAIFKGVVYRTSQVW